MNVSNLEVGNEETSQKPIPTYETSEKMVNVRYSKVKLTNNHNKNPPRETKTKNDPDEKEQNSHNGKHLDMYDKLLKKMSVET